MDQLRGLRHVDVAIVGGGLTGLLLASALSQDGCKVAVLEASDSPHTPAIECATLHCTEAFSRAATAHSLDIVRHYARGLQTHLNALLTASLPYIQPAPAYLYAKTAEALPLLEKHRNLLMKLGLSVHAAPDAGGCPFPVELSLYSQGAIVNMQRWMAALRASILHNGGKVYTSSRVTGIDGSRLCTSQGALQAATVVLTTGKPLGLHDHRLLALLESRSMAHCHLIPDAPLHSIQQPIQAGISLFPTSSGVHAAMDLVRCGTRQEQQRFRQFDSNLTRLLPDWQQGEIQFSTQVVSADGLPVIGTMPGSRMLFASGYGGCGILGAMHAAEVLHRRLTGHMAPEDALYSPDRAFPRGLIRREQHRIAILRAAGILRPRAPLCSHCSCRMRYFIPASRWECPSCGSACTMLGQPLTSPGMAPVAVSPRQRPN